METDGGKRIEQVFLQGAVNACSRTSPSVFATWDGWILDEERERESPQFRKALSIEFPINFLVCNLKAILI